MTLEEVAHHRDHTKVKKSLECATEGCEAKISFVSGSGGRKDHFRTVRYSEHSMTCLMHQNKELSEKKIQRNKVIEGSLDSKGAEQRVRYFFHKIFNPNKNKKPKKRKRKTSSGEAESRTQVILGGKNSPSVDKIKEDNKNVTVRVPTRELNQISEADEGNYFQLYARVEKVTETKEGFELDLFLGEFKAKLILPESFFMSTRNVDTKEHLKSLSLFLKSQSDSYEVSIFTFCMFDRYNGNKTIIYTYDYENFFISVSGPQHNPRNLASFQALFKTGVWPK